MKLLVVENDYYLKYIYKKTLVESLNCDCELAADWREGKIFFVHQIFELIIMDINLPGSSGIEALKEIRQLKPKQKVLIASSFGTKENIIQLAQYKANGFLSKPFSMGAFMHKVESILK